MGDPSIPDRLSLRLLSYRSDQKQQTAKFAKRARTRTQIVVLFSCIFRVGLRNLCNRKKPLLRLWLRAERECAGTGPESCQSICGRTG